MTADEAVLSLHAAADDPAVGTTRAVLRTRLLGAAKNPAVQGEDRLPGTSHYFVGNDTSKWRSGAEQYAKVRYHAVYPGIDLIYYGNQRQLEYDFVVAAGADPGRIRLAYTGADTLRLGADGNLRIATPGGELVQHKPVLYQTIDGRRQPVAGRFTLIDKGRSTEVAFAVGDYDRSRDLIIDPVLAYSTYLGGTGDDIAYALAVDAQGNAYIAGSTSSTDFPTVNPLQAAHAGGNADAFVAKLNADGSALVYATYLGGSDFDSATALAVDADGNAFVAGEAQSTDFPTGNPLQAAHAGGNADAFVAKLNADGSALLYATYLGGGTDETSTTDQAFALAVDAGGNAYVAGNTTSDNFPTTPGVVQGDKGASNDAFIAKINADGSALLYATYLGGSNSVDGIAADQAFAIAVDADGNAYVAGNTGADDFPIANPMQGAPGGGIFDGFIAKLNADGTTLLYSTYLGGAGDEFTVALAVDDDGNAHVGGQTSSTDFPTLSPLQSANAGSSDAFVAKLDTGGALAYATYLGGSSTDSARALAVDDDGNAYVAGATSSPNFPTVDPLQADNAGGSDAFIAKLDASGGALLYATYLGSAGDDIASALAVDVRNNAYLAGNTGSTDFPMANPLQAGYAGENDAFIAKLAVYTRYFAEGAIGAFFDTTFTIYNPNDGEVVATMIFGSETGESVPPHTVAVPAHEQVIVDAETILPEGWIGFSTTVESDQLLVTTRTQRWDARHYGGHASIGVPAPQTEWWFTEGASGMNELYYLLYNPDDDETATVEITYFRSGGPDPVVRSYQVAPQTRSSIFVNVGADGAADPDLGDTELSARLVSTNGVPIVAERAMYLTTNDRQPLTAGHVAPAVTTPTTFWHFAEGATDFFDLFLSLANPTEGPVDVTVQYLLPTGDPLVRTYELLAGSRRTIFVDQEDPRLAETQVAVTVESETPIGAERTMWWGVGDAWEAGHVSTGALEPALRWGLSALELGGPDSAEGYVLIANPSGTNAEARLTLVTPEGGTTFGPVTVSLAAGTRNTFRLVDLFPAARAQVEPVSVLVESTGSELIVVEGASYASTGGQPLTTGMSNPALPLP